MRQDRDVRPGRHLLVNFPPTVALSRLLNSLKGGSSRRLRQEFPDLARHSWRARRPWSGSYFAGSVGVAPLHVLRAYIGHQHRPHDTIHLRPSVRSPRESLVAGVPGGRDVQGPDEMLEALFSGSIDRLAGGHGGSTGQELPG
jgi:Transposase IS200 like